MRSALFSDAATTTIIKQENGKNGYKIRSADEKVSNN